MRPTDGAFDLSVCLIVAVKVGERLLDRAESDLRWAQGLEIRDGWK